MIAAECDLCGNHGLTRVALVEWALGIGEPYANVDRCQDEAACRRRIEARGDDWPVRDPKHPKETA